jgi:hypothetical protein
MAARRQKHLQKVSFKLAGIHVIDLIRIMSSTVHFWTILPEQDMPVGRQHTAAVTSKGCSY